MKDIQVKLQGMLDLNTAGAEQQVQSFKQNLEKLGQSRHQEVQTARQGQQDHPVSGLQQTEMQRRTTQWLREHNVQQGTFLANKKKINSLYREELGHVRSLEDEMAQLKHTEHGLSRKQLATRERDVREARSFTNSLRDTISSGMSRELYQRELGGGRSVGVMGGVSQVGQTLGIGRMLGGMGRFALRNPLLAIPAVIAGGAVWGQKKADESAAYSEGIGMQFLDTARMTGRNRKLRDQFYQAPGETSEAFQRLGYSGEHIAKMASAYGMPTKGKLKDSLLPQAEFARAFGYGKSPEVISGMGRRATQLGAAEPGQQGQFWALMTSAVQQGISKGVDASETLKAMMGYTEETAKRLGVVSREQLAGLGGLQALLAGGESRFFKGERGAKETENLLDGIMNPKTIAGKRFVMNAILGSFDGRTPSAKDIGLEGYEAKGYSKMNQIQQLEVVMQKLPSLLTSNNPQAQGLMAELFRRFGLSAGSTTGGKQLLFQVIYGMQSAKALEMQQGVFEAVAALPGMERKKALEMGPFELISEITRRAPKKALSLLKGVKPEAALSQAEEFQAIETQIKEMGSARYEQSKTVKGLRDTMKNIRKGFTGGLTKQLLGTEDVAGQFTDEVLKVVPFGGHFRGREPIKDSSMGARAFPQSYHPSPPVREQVIRVDVSGTVEIRGEAVDGGAVKLSGQELGTVLLRRVEAQLRRDQTMGQQRGGWSEAMI